MNKDLQILNYSHCRIGTLGFRLVVKNLYIERGVVTGIVGPSGSGKSTLFSLLAGVIDDSLGSRVREVFPKIAYLMHETALVPWRSSLKNFLLECRLRSEAISVNRFSALVARCGLDDDVTMKPVCHLSFGMRQRMELARALAFSPDLLIVDEGLSGLDRKLKLNIFGLILEEVEARNMAVIFTSHFLTDVITFSDRIYKVSGGVLAESAVEIGIEKSERLALSELELLGRREITSAMSSLM